MKNKEIAKMLEKLHKGKMKSLISELLKEAIEGLMRKQLSSPVIMETLNKELISAVKIIFKEDLELKEHDEADKHYFGFYLDDKLIFEYGYIQEDENDKTRHKILN